MNNADTPKVKIANVLIIDDNVILLRTVKDMLDSKYNVSIAASGSQAFQAIAMKKPDVILLDYQIPNMDGEEIIKLLHKGEDTSDIPIIFLTSSASREVVTKLISLNPDGYMLKPPNKQTLIEHIEKVLHKE